MTARIRVTLPAHLRTLAHVDGEVMLDLPNSVTLRTVLDQLEAVYPMLRGTIRELGTHRRRAFIRFFACGLDLSDEALDSLLPAEVVTGEQPLRIVGAMAGG